MCRRISENRLPAELLEYEKAKKDLKQQNAEIDRRGKVANSFRKAYEKASLLTATEEDVRCWTEGTRMTLEELRDTVKESREIAQAPPLPISSSRTIVPAVRLAEHRSHGGYSL